MKRKEVLLGNIKAVLGNTQAIEYFDAVVAVLFSAGKFVMVRHSKRGWEFPGGRRQDKETYKETVVREIFEEAGARVEDFRLLGYYTSAENHSTVITCAEVSSFETLPHLDEIADVGLFELLPDELSFGNGREELFLNYARETGSSQQISQKEAI